MAYTSNELTHFVGRSLASDSLRYDLLANIVRSGRLIDPYHLNRQDPIFRVRMAPSSGDPGDVLSLDGVDYISNPNVIHDAGSKLSDNSLLRFEIVCFCDIPTDDIHLQCSKYSYFGVSFSKGFLVKQGAAPVMYVPKDGTLEIVIREEESKTGNQNEEKRLRANRSSLFDETFRFHNGLWMDRLAVLEAEMRKAFGEHGQLEDITDAVDKVWHMLFYQSGIEGALFSHLKFFDAGLPDNDINNFYMEREWRVSGRVEFALDDIEHIFVPSAFVTRAAADFPSVSGRIKALDPPSAV